MNWGLKSSEKVKVQGHDTSDQNRETQTMQADVYSLHSTVANFRPVQIVFWIVYRKGRDWP